MIILTVVPIFNQTDLHCLSIEHEQKNKQFSMEQKMMGSAEKFSCLSLWPFHVSSIGSFFHTYPR